MGSFEKLCFWRYVPLAGYFILVTELCERFCYYGMLAILPTFFTGQLGLKQSSAVSIMSCVSFASYGFAFLGAVVSDSYWGRFKTIAVFSFLYSVGMFGLSFSAYPSIFGWTPSWWVPFIPLAIITIGTGGIKPCVSSFGGDQIESAEKRGYFFNYFYLMINIGSLASMFLVPLIKSIPSAGRPDCYWGAFLLPAALMLSAFIVFVFGYARYKPGPPKNSIMLDFFCAAGLALRRKVSMTVKRVSHERPAHWLHYASDRYTLKTLEHARAMLTVLKTFLPMCLYWGLYSQMSSRWVYQAQLMTGKVSIGALKFTALPEQMGMINCFLVLVFVPVFDAFVYPVVARVCGRPITPYAKIIVSMGLGFVSFLVAGALQVYIQAHGTFKSDPLNPESMVCIAGCTNMMWQIPQYIILTASEVVLCTANLALAYAMAPPELKSLCNAMSMVTNAAGNLLVMFMAKVNPVGLVASKSQEPAGNFFMWAGLCAVGIIWFVVATWSMTFPEDKDQEPIILQMVAIDDEDKLAEQQPDEPTDKTAELKAEPNA